MSIQTTIVNTIIPHVIEFFTKGEVTADEIARIQAFVVALEDKAIDKAVKNQQTADLIKSLSNNLSEEVIQWIITTINLLLAKSPYVAEVTTAVNTVETVIDSVKR